MMSVQAVVTSDSLPYKIPGQKRPEPPRKYVVAYARQGDTIELDQEDFDRFRTLGVVVEEGSKAAKVAKRRVPKWGPPAGATRLTNSESLLAADEEDEETGVSGEAPPEVDETNAAALGALNLVQLKNIAEARGVEVDSRATKAKLVEAIVEKAGEATT